MPIFGTPHYQAFQSRKVPNSGMNTDKVLSPKMFSGSGIFADEIKVVYAKRSWHINNKAWRIPKVFVIPSKRQS